MKFLTKIAIVFFILLPISHSFANVTFKQQLLFFEDQQNINGLAFNEDGSKFFTITSHLGGEDFVTEWNLSTPYDISTRSYAGDSERCFLDAPDDVNQVDAGNQGATGGGDIAFSSDGLTMLTTNRGTSSGKNDFVLRFDLTTAYDISTCQYNSGRYIDTDALQEVDTFELREEAVKHYLSGIAIKPDGTKIFLNFNDSSGDKDKDSIKEYTLSTPFDLSTMTVETTAIQLNINDNPEGMSFSNDGKKLFLANKNANNIEQYSLPTAYSLVGAVKDGTVTPRNSSGGTIDISGLTFNGVGLKVYIASQGSEIVFEYDLQCPFTIIGGTCPPISENKDRMGMAEAQIELANRTVKLSTNSALNRLKWIRRNKDKENLSNQNIKLNFSNNLLSSLTELPISSFKKISSSENNNNNKNYFYWSEGSISLGKVGDTSISSMKNAKTEALTFGFDKFTDDYSLTGFAFRFGNDNVDVGNSGSKLDSNTYNITYYSTSPVQDDTKFVDKIFGIGKIRSSLLTIMDGEGIIADRTGNQIYGTVKLKDEFIKGKLTLIPSGQFDFAHTILKGYQESGNAGIIVNDQHVRTRNFRAAIAAVEDLSKKNYSFKRHGKIEYIAELDRSSNFKYTYVEDKSVKFNDTLHTGALHNLNAEVGVDIIFPEHYSIFIIYERNQAFETGHTDNLYVALGYLPKKDTEIAFTINGSENLMSEFEIKKDINGFDLIFNLNDDLTRFGDAREAYIELNKVF